MNTNISERQQVLLILFLAGAVIFLLWYGLLLPQTTERKKAEKDIAAMNTELAKANYLRVGEDVLKNKKEELEKYNSDLRDWWQKLADRLEAFPDLQGQTNLPVEFIDYKVKLFAVEDRVRDKAADLDVRIPRDLGMDDKIRGEDNARLRMLQLRAVEKLLDLVINLKVGAIRTVEPLLPILHKTETGQTFVEEYPVQIVFQGSLDKVYRLHQALQKSENDFVARRMRVQKLATATGWSDQVEAQAVLSALVFCREARAMVPTEIMPAGPVAPMGH